MTNLDPDAVEEIKEIYAHFDSDDNGIIDFKEFGNLIGALPGDMSNEEIQIGFDIVDSDNNGNISFEEFIDWWGNR